MKKLRLLALGCFFAAALCISALAVDTTQLTYVTTNEYYNDETGQFVFTRSELNGGAIYSNIADGMVTTDTVSISADNGIELKLYTSGIELTDVDLTQISDPGFYTLTAASGGEMTYTMMDFTIIRSTTGTISTYTMPAGFSVTGLTRDGETLGTSTGAATFDEEGLYSVDYICYQTGVPYSLTFRYDATPPTLALSNVVDGEARGPVSVADLEENANLYVYLDGEQITVPSDKLLDSTGTYYLILTDQAGNITEYNFKIGVYFNLNAIVAICILLAVIIGITVYLYIHRKKMKIR